MRRWLNRNEIDQKKEKNDRECNEKERYLYFPWNCLSLGGLTGLVPCVLSWKRIEIFSSLWNRNPPPIISLPVPQSWAEMSLLPHHSQRGVSHYFILSRAPTRGGQAGSARQVSCWRERVRAPWERSWPGVSRAEAKVRGVLPGGAALPALPGVSASPGDSPADRTEGGAERLRLREGGVVGRGGDLAGVVLQVEQFPGDTPPGHGPGWRVPAGGRPLLIARVLGRTQPPAGQVRGSGQSLTQGLLAFPHKVRNSEDVGSDGFRVRSANTIRDFADVIGVNLAGSPELTDASKQNIAILGLLGDSAQCFIGDFSLVISERSVDVPAGDWAWNDCCQS